VTERDWDKELAKIDKEISRKSAGGNLEEAADAQMFPQKKGASADQRAAVDEARATTRSWPAILRLGLSVALGIGIMFWPYENRCGVGLTGYILAVIAVVGSGVWSAVWTWRHRAARAHSLSLLLILWGLILGSAEVLPRVGYAKQTLRWQCIPTIIR